MLRSLKALERYTVRATDGEVGSVANFLLDDGRWIVRYLILDPSASLEPRRILIPPVPAHQTARSARRFCLPLTMYRIKRAPAVDEDLPPSREHERNFYHHFGYPYYWVLDEPAPGEFTVLSDKVRLRSVKSIDGYCLHGSDAAVGHVSDVIIDDHDWEVRYLVVDTGAWWSGHKVLLSPHWASRIDWAGRKVHVDMPCAAIKDSPEWGTAEDLDRRFENGAHEYYGHPVYWSAGPPLREPANPESTIGDVTQPGLSWLARATRNSPA
jgi:hypothetical protein